MKNLRFFGVIVVSACILSACGSSLSGDTRTSLASCITDAGWTMYGTNRCSHCKAQKELFGDAFEKISFVNCENDAAICTAAGVAGYPTWINQSGERLSGQKTLSELAEAANCLEVLGE